LLAFNALAIQSLSAVTAGSKSIFSKKENDSALVLVASQVIIDFFGKQINMDLGFPHLRNIKK
jgi:hypothetical protein